MLVLPRNSNEQFLATQVHEFIQSSVQSAAFNDKELAVVRKPAIKVAIKSTPKLFAVQYRVSKF